MEALLPASLWKFFQRFTVSSTLSQFMASSNTLSIHGFSQILSQFLRNVGACWMKQQWFGGPIKEQQLEKLTPHLGSPLFLIGTQRRFIFELFNLFTSFIWIVCTCA